jgi:regulator of protease activity HflC (stomatin/prohibitin superfamily)
MGIGGLFGAISLLGFLLFLGGIGLAVAGASQGRSARGGVVLAVLGLVAGLLFSVIGQGILIIEPTQVAVIVNTVNGELDPNPRRGGTSIILPVVQQPFIYPISQQSVTMDEQAGGEGPVVARTSDGQEVRLDVSVIFSVNPADVNLLHRSWQGRYEQGLVVPVTRGVVRDAVSAFEAGQIYAGGRETLSVDAFNRLTTRLQRDGLLVSDLIVRDITFSDQYAQAIEQAQVAAQEAERARLQVQQRQAEAQQLVASAEGERDAAVARAQGEAESIVLRARAEAEALQLVSEQIAANPALIQYQYIQSLADNVNLALIPSNSPFLFDLQSLMDSAPGEGFAAPAVRDAIVPGIPGATATPAPGN